LRTWQVSVVFLFALVVFSLFGGVASAHHSRAGFDTDEKITTLKGTVTEFRFRNPHVVVFFDVKDASGKVVNWSGEFSSVRSMISEGMGRDTLKLGEELAITVIPAKEGRPQALVIKIVRANGNVAIDLTARRGLLRAQ